MILILIHYQCDGCLFDPTCALALLDVKHTQIRDCAKAHILSEAKKSVQNDLHSASASAVSAEIASATSAAMSVHLTKWKFLVAKQLVDERRLIPGNEAQTELNKYFIDIRNSPMYQNSLNFWKIRHAVYPHLAPIAEDLIAAPATQAYVERLFSIYGLFTNGQRNQISASLECEFS